MPSPIDPAQRALVWFRRDLRSVDHAALAAALSAHPKVWCVFVFDTDILSLLPDKADRRVAFIHASLAELDAALRAQGGGLIVRYARAVDEIPKLAAELGVDAVLTNHDYEPAAVERDAAVAKALAAQGRALLTFKDQVVREKDEVLTLAGKSFTVFTPYKNAWLKSFQLPSGGLDTTLLPNYDCTPAPQQMQAPAATDALPSLAQMGFDEVGYDRWSRPYGRFLHPHRHLQNRTRLSRREGRILSVGTPALRHDFHPGTRRSCLA